MGKSVVRKNKEIVGERKGLVFVIWLVQESVKALQVPHLEEYPLLYCSSPISRVPSALLGIRNE